MWAVEFPNPPPTANAGPDQSVLNGDLVTLDGSTSTDPDGDIPLVFSWQIASRPEGSMAALDDPGSETPNFTPDVPGTYIITLGVTDTYGAESGPDQVTITVTPVNDAPVLGTIVAPVDPVMAGDSVLISAPFSDPDTDDTHSAICSWGDDSPPAPCTVQEESGSGTVSCSHTYAVPGVYLVNVELSDNYGLNDIKEFTYIVIFDPEGGFVTGGGWITSPPGAYPADTNLSGKATFGFVSKYKKGATVPTGETEFQFKLAGLNFHSESYQWLVVAGPRAQYKGTGEINGEGDYGFILTAIDGAISGGGGLDKFRIKIWDIETESIVYDNQIDSDDTADPTTVIGGGSIVIHKS